jgi:hypothetical protein
MLAEPFLDYSPSGAAAVRERVEKRFERKARKEKVRNPLIIEKDLSSIKKILVY